MKLTAETLSILIEGIWSVGDDNYKLAYNKFHATGEVVIEGCNIEESVIINSSKGKKIRFEKCKFKFIEFESIGLDALIFVGCHIQHLELKTVKINLCHFINCEIETIGFTQSAITGFLSFNLKSDLIIANNSEIFHFRIEESKRNSKELVKSFPIENIQLNKCECNDIVIEHSDIKTVFIAKDSEVQSIILEIQSNLEGVYLSGSRCKEFLFKKDSFCAAFYASEDSICGSV